jgi:hypothetical protein
MARIFNPPPGWPVLYGFEPPPGWEPDPDWPPAPPGWPLWIGSDTPRGARGGSADGGYSSGHSRPQPAWPAAGQMPASPRGSYLPAGYVRPPQFGRRRLTLRSLVIVLTVVGVLVIGSFVESAVNNAHRSPATGRIVKKGHLDVFSLRKGDCFQSKPLSVLEHGVAGVRAVPCRTAHNAQVFAQFRAADTRDYPGHKDLVRQGNHGCAKRLGAIDRARTPRSARIGFIYPDAVAWFDGQRKISCIVRVTRGALRASLLRRGAGRRSPRSGRTTPA